MNMMESNFANSFIEKQQERERQEKEIDEVVEKLKNELKEKSCYKEFEIFIDYLASFKRIIIDFEGDRQKIESEYIGAEIQSLASQARINPKVLSYIKEEFSKRIEVKNIQLVAEKILKGCPLDNGEDTDDYQKFISYLEKTYEEICEKIHNVFNEEKDSDIETLKERLIEEKIKELSADGIPTEEELRKIYADFEKSLNKN